MAQRWVTAVYGVVSVLLGIVVQTRPEPAAKILLLLFALHLLVTGVVRIVQAAVSRGVARGARAFTAVVGVIWIASAIVLLLVPITTLTVLAVTFGAVLVAQAVLGLVDAVRNRTVWPAVAHVVTLAAGIAVLVWPGKSFAVLLWVLGVWMVVHGTITLIGAVFPNLFGEVPASSPARADPRHAV
ncbi:HdeD family acid-resistance protein [Cellulomonas sp. NPDC055163]